MVSFKIFWWCIELIHFLLGSWGFIFAKSTIIMSYSLFPKIKNNIKIFEIMRVTGIFYMNFAFLSFLNIFHPKLNIFSSILYSQFYAIFFAYDLIDFFTLGYSSNKSKYTDASLHLLFGLVHMYLFVF